MTLTEYSISVFKPVPGATVLTDNGAGDGTKQATFTKLDATPIVAVDDIVRVTLKGVSDVDITEFQVLLVDESADASTPYWTELSAFTAADPADISAGVDFDITIDVTVLLAPVGTSTKNQNIVLMAKTTSGLIQLSLTEFTAEIVDPTDPGDPTDISIVENSIASITVISANGVVLQTINSIEELGAGVHFIQIEYASGDIETKKIVK